MKFNKMLNVKLIFIIVALCTSACQTTTVSKVPPVADASEMQEEQNKSIAVACLDLMFNQKKLKEAKVQCFGDVYIQHSPRNTDGVDEILSGFAGFFSMNPELTVDIKRSAADGDLVWIHSHMKMKPEDLGSVMIDIFRLEKGKLVEHWSAVKPVAEKSLNNNTEF